MKDIESMLLADLQEILNIHIGNKQDSGNISAIQSGLLGYLQNLIDTMGYSYLPLVEVESDVGIVSVNFLDKNNSRLETVGDIIMYMDTGINYSSTEE